MQGGRDASLVGKTVTVARPGGVVRLRDAVQDALGKQGGPTYSEQELREGWADITFNGMRQSAVGDQVGLFMKANPPGNKTAGIQADYVLVDSVYGLFRRVGTSYVRDAEARQVLRAVVGDLQREERRAEGGGVWTSPEARGTPLPLSKR